jgi:hypothetical protein
MGKHIHYKIAGWLKIIVVVAFIVNTVRILVRTWKYGGSKSAVSINYDDMPNDDAAETVEEM